MLRGRRRDKACVVGMRGEGWVCRFRGLSGCGWRLGIGRLRGRRERFLPVPGLLVVDLGVGGVCMGILRWVRM